MSQFRRVVLGLDPSLTRTGYCVLAENFDGKGLLLDIGTLPPPAYAQAPPAAMMSYVQGRVARLLEGHLSVRALTLPDAPIEVACEGAIFVLGDAVAQLYALQMFLQQVFFERRVKVAYFAPDVWKSVLFCVKDGTRPPGCTPVGRIRKANVMKLCKQRTRLTGLNNDMADAWGLATVGVRFFQAVADLAAGLQPVLTTTQEYFFRRAHQYKRGVLKGATRKEGLLFKKDRLWFDFGEKEKWASPNFPRCSPAM